MVGKGWRTAKGDVDKREYYKREGPCVDYRCWSAMNYSIL